MPQGDDGASGRTSAQAAVLGGRPSDEDVPHWGRRREWGESAQAGVPRAVGVGNVPREDAGASGMSALRAASRRPWEEEHAPGRRRGKRDERAQAGVPRAVEWGTCPGETPGRAG